MVKSVGTSQTLRKTGIGFAERVDGQAAEALMRVGETLQKRLAKDDWDLVCIYVSMLCNRIALNGAAVWPGHDMEDVLGDLKEQSEIAVGMLKMPA